MERIPGLDDWLTRGPEEYDHDPRCPGHDDYQCDECVKAKAQCCDHAQDMDCICDDLESEAKSNAAEAKSDELRERKYNP